MLTHECKGNASYKHLSIKQENIDLYYKNKPRIFATVPRNAIQYYYEVNKRLKTDIRDVIKEIEREVDKLDIDSIIDSYETTVSEWTLL